MFHFKKMGVFFLKMGVLIYINSVFLETVSHYIVQVGFECSPGVCHHAQPIKSNFILHKIHKATLFRISAS